MQYQIHHGDNREVLKTFEDNSIDSIVTDPPYELGFMGKSWDASGIAFNTEVWQECLRVLKPGGHLLAFSGSRTYHRMAVAIEDAGFEIRDQIMWIYGSGFPKSLDIGKAVDKNDATLARRERDLKFTEWMRSTGLKARQIDDITQSNMGGHYLTDKEQPTVATAEMFDKLRPYLPEVPEWVEEMVRQRTIESENFKKREVVGTKDTNLLAVAPGQDNDRSATTLDITAPATAEAKQWQGWGTALKPAHEPIVVARKPLIGTVAANVLTYGTGGLNIDATRVGSGTGETKTVSYPDIRGNNYNNANGTVEYTVTDQGRWPANVIHDGSDEVVGLFPISVSKQSMRGVGLTGSNVYGSGDENFDTLRGHNDSGSASRFFYCAKASKRDRNEGINSANHHPTVKPTELMRYLCRLVTPPDGTVLDPFMGSGSTGKAAIYEGFNFVGIEMTDEYIPIAKARIEFAINEESERLKI